MATCENPQCKDFPIYGVAPHLCYWRKEGGFINKLGTSEKAPPENPAYAHFVLEVEHGEDPNLDRYAGGCGVYYCPTCKAGMPQNLAKNKYGAFYQLPKTEVHHEL